MRPRILDPTLLAKISKKLGRTEQSVRVTVSKNANKLGISSEAALILLAKEQGIGTSTFQRKLDTAKQAEVRDALPAIFMPSNKKVEPAKAKAGTRRQPVVSNRKALKLTIEYLIQDPDLLSRCGDLLLASGKFDRAISQATLVLEDRIRSKAQPPTGLVGENLVAYAFNEDLSKTRLEVPGGDKDDQRGYTQQLRGVVPAFRNKTHHHLIESFTREDAMRVCGFIDVLLRVVDGSTRTSVQ